MYNFIALEAKTCVKYEELVRLVETQTMDPITGVTRGEKPPGLSHVTKAQRSEEDLQRDQVADMLLQAGVDCSTEEGEWILNAVGKAKGKGKG